jgi:hypothetical protein
MGPQETYGKHDYVYDPTYSPAGYPCLICGELELDDEPWLPQHNVPEGWD